MPSYVTVTAEAIEGLLRRKGFVRTVQFREVVYVRRSSRMPAVVVKVYTSVGTGAQAARGVGDDSIKVCTVFDDGSRSFGIGKFPRVHRTGSPEKVLERTMERVRQACERGNEWIAGRQAREAAQAEALRLREKADFARLERQQEEAGFMSDPDMRAFLDQDPCSEPCSGEPC